MKHFDEEIYKRLQKILNKTIDFIEEDFLFGTLLNIKDVQTDDEKEIKTYLKVLEQTARCFDLEDNDEQLFNRNIQSIYEQWIENKEQTDGFLSLFIRTAFWLGNDELMYLATIKLKNKKSKASVLAFMYFRGIYFKADEEKAELILSRVMPITKRNGGLKYFYKMMKHPVFKPYKKALQNYEFLKQYGL